MKGLLPIFAALVCAQTALASDDNYQPTCIDQAKAAVAKKAKVSLNKLSLYNAGTLGDGVSVVESIALTADGTSGFYIINMMYDDCSVFLGPKFISN